MPFLLIIINNAYNCIYDFVFKSTKKPAFVIEDGTRQIQNLNFPPRPDVQQKKTACVLVSEFLCLIRLILS